MTLAAPCQTILEGLLPRLASKGFEARTMFDLHQARRSSESSDAAVCPHHGLGECSCQYVVLQIRRLGGSPSSVVLHGSDNSTRVVLVSAPDEKVDAGIAAELCEALELVRAHNQSR
ncbi:MAG: hypothetical protein ABSG17_15585 [Spirochaetia bacterium]|jgi:hypothetical protein